MLGYQRAMKVGPVPFSTGVDSGNQTIILSFGPLDFSWKQQLQAILKVTSGDTDAADTLDGVLQFTYDNQETWHAVGAFGQIIGTASPTPTAPEMRWIIVQQGIPLEATEEAQEPTGSLGATPLGAGTVRHATFPPKAYVNGRVVDSVRVVLTVVDADENAEFAGDVTLIAWG